MRIRGRVEAATDAEADLTFDDRPRASRVTAWAACQSRPVGGRDVLEARYAEASSRFADAPVPRPETWRAYRLVPSAIEFWQARRYRLHERQLFERQGTGWRVTLLEP